MIYFISAFAAAVIILAAVLVIRTLLFKPIKKPSIDMLPVFVDGTEAVHSLSELIKCKTVSYSNPELEDREEFDRFRKKLPILFPSVFEKCSEINVGDKSVLIKWKGKSSGSPTVLMAHYDVVSAEPENWINPPFDGVIENGVIWGRGAIDTKGTLNGIFFAVEALIKEGYIPEKDIYLAFAGDEEVDGHGAVDILAYFKENSIIPAMVLDEGGAVVENVFPGVKEPCALIGIAEKGMLNIEYSVSGGGGHASSPERITPIGRLSRACVRMEKKNPFKFKISAPAAKMFDDLARHSTFAYRLIFANLWLFAPVLNIITKKNGGELNAIVRTTTAFTQAEGSKGRNVIPPQAKMLSNHRIIPGETTDSVINAVKKTVNDSEVDIRAVNGMNPSRVSQTAGAAWKLLTESVSETWNGAIVSPYLMLACSDSRHWGEISDKVYRFSPMALTKEERGYIHGNNERLPIATVAKIAEFYIRLMRKI